jgi:hypothetical protein
VPGDLRERDSEREDAHVRNQTQYGADPRWSGVSAGQAPGRENSASGNDQHGEGEAPQQNVEGRDVEPGTAGGAVGAFNDVEQAVEDGGLLEQER